MAVYLCGRDPSRHAPDVAVGVGGGGVVLHDSAGVLGHEEVRLARRHRSPGSHGIVDRPKSVVEEDFFFSLHIISWREFVIQAWKTRGGESLTSS